MITTFSHQTDFNLVALIGTSVMCVSIIIFDKFSMLLTSSAPNNYGLPMEFGLSIDEWWPGSDPGYELIADVNYGGGIE